MKKILFYVGLLWSLSGSLAAQPIPNTDFEAYRRAREGLVLLANHGQRLPLRQLDHLRPALISIGLEDDHTLWQTLNQYQPVGRLLPDEEGGLRAVSPGDEWAGPNEYNAWIIAVDVAALGLGGIVFPFDSLRAIADEAIWVFFGTSSQLKNMQKSETSVMLYSPTADDWSQSLIAQAIYGGIELQNTLKTALSTDFPVGYGLALPPASRLGYAPPEAVGINGPLLRDSLNAIMQHGLAAGAYPGAQLLVARQGVVVYHETFGQHTYEPDAQAVQPSDLYDLASITKISTGLPILMRLYGQGRLDLDEKLGTYLPMFAKGNKADLVLRDLLTHQARLRAWIPYWRGTLKGHSQYPWEADWDNNRLNDYNFRPKTLSRDSSARYPIQIADGLWRHRNYHRKLYESIRISPLNEKPGYVYSDMFFTVLPPMLRGLIGQPMEDYLRDSLYRPLGAYTMGFNPWRTYSLKRVVPTERDTFFRMSLLHGRVHDEGAALLGGVSGHAGLFASANDLAKLMQLYLNGGVYGQDTLIAPAAVAEFTRCQFAAQGNHRGLGFDKPFLTYDPARSMPARDASPASFGHSGYTGTFTWADPANGLLLVFMSNRVHPTRDNLKLSKLSIRSRVHQAAYDAVKGGEE